MTGIEMIAAERRRQIEEEGWTAELDDDHKFGELSMAGAYYAWPGHAIVQTGWFTVKAFVLWPWEGMGKKKDKPRIRQLTIAGALIAAEIDRLSRLGKEDGVK